MEAIVRPVKWNEWPDSATNIFQAFRSNAGEELILNKNIFIEGVLPNSIIRNLDEKKWKLTENHSSNPVKTEDHR